MRIVDHRAVLAMMQTGGAQIVDTLPTHEYGTVHIRGAIHLPLNRLWHDARDALSPTRPVVVYCRDSL
jgi:rhodanese-related sulfurtransferase